MKTVVVDAETRSLLDLRKVGAARYARHPSTDVWCVAYAIDDDPVQLWLPGEPVPPAIVEAATDPNCVFVAHNANFERSIIEHILTPRYGWPAIPVERWRCTMAAALALALPADLGKVAAALSLPHQKINDPVVRLMWKRAVRVAMKTQTVPIGSTTRNVCKLCMTTARAMSKPSARCIDGCSH